MDTITVDRATTVVGSEEGFSLVWFLADGAVEQTPNSLTLGEQIVTLPDSRPAFVYCHASLALHRLDEAYSIGLIDDMDVSSMITCLTWAGEPDYATLLSLYYRAFSCASLCELSLTGYLPRNRWPALHHPRWRPPCAAKISFSPVKRTVISPCVSAHIPTICVPSL